MIGHDNVANDVMSFVFQMIEPAVNDFVTIGDFKQRDPLIAGEGNEKDSLITGDISTDAHD